VNPARTVRDLKEMLSEFGDDEIVMSPEGGNGDGGVFVDGRSLQSYGFRVILTGGNNR
jgi:hypothetical protein